MTCACALYSLHMLAQLGSLPIVHRTGQTQAQKRQATLKNSKSTAQHTRCGMSTFFSYFFAHSRADFLRRLRRGFVGSMPSPSEVAFCTKKCPELLRFPSPHADRSTSLRTTTGRTVTRSFTDRNMPLMEGVFLWTMV